MKVAVYLGSSILCKEEYNQLAFETGSKLVKNGHEVIYGGSNVGTMKYLADGAQSENGIVTGVFPKGFQGTPDIRKKGIKVTRENLSRMILTKDFAERKQTMEELCDCCLVLPGSFGTLDELFTFACDSVIGTHTKKAYILNYKGFYTPIKDLLQNASEAGFLKPDTLNVITFCDTIDQFIENIK